MPGRRNNADAYRTKPVLACVFLFVFAAVAGAQFKPCQENGQGSIIIGTGLPDIKPVRIHQMPEASYTDAAREAGVFGTVTLKVRFLAGGRIGLITVVDGLPEGLTSEAISAARKIIFGPARQKARMIHTSEIVAYHFSDPKECSSVTGKR
ncbi:MAG: energy transducer TonB [Saprospiraceae bacterium]|nr:energy transducer TonB [Pyrinomonadaceae bacterium]